MYYFFDNDKLITTKKTILFLSFKTLQIKNNSNFVINDSLEHLLSSKCINIAKKKGKKEVNGLINKYYLKINKLTIWKNKLFLI